MRLAAILIGASRGLRVIDGGKKQTLKELGDAEIARRDAVFDRMSFLDYSMTAMGLMLEGDYIAGPFEILGRARDPPADRLLQRPG